VALHRHKGLEVAHGRQVEAVTMSADLGRVMVDVSCRRGRPLGDVYRSRMHSSDVDLTRVDLSPLIRRALEIKVLYDELNDDKRGRTWTNEEFTLGFVGDVGDLAKLVMAQEGAREMPGGRAALGHELADCLWSVLILADAYGIDVADEFARAMNELSASIRSMIDET
jgi:NTP pyrophosphatase (non-canonical NTP hydrolase)